MRASALGAQIAVAFAKKVALDAAKGNRCCSGQGSATRSLAESLSSLALLQEASRRGGYEQRWIDRSVKSEQSEPDRYPSGHRVQARVQERRASDQANAQSLSKAVGRRALSWAAGMATPGLRGGGPGGSSEVLVFEAPVACGEWFIVGGDDKISGGEIA